MACAPLIPCLLGAWVTGNTRVLWLPPTTEARLPAYDLPLRARGRSKERFHGPTLPLRQFPADLAIEARIGHTMGTPGFVREGVFHGYAYRSGNDHVTADCGRRLRLDDSQLVADTVTCPDCLENIHPWVGITILAHPAEMRVRRRKDPWTPMSAHDRLLGHAPAPRATVRHPAQELDPDDLVISPRDRRQDGRRFSARVA